MTDSLRRISIPNRLVGGLVVIFAALAVNGVSTYMAVARALEAHTIGTELAEGVLASVARSQVVVFVVVLVVLSIAGWVLLRSIVPPLLEFVRSVKHLIVPLSGEAASSEYRIDLARRLDERGADEVAELARHINRMLASVHDVVAEIQACNSDIGTSAQRLAGVSVRNREGIARQQEDTDQLASAVEQMHGAVDEVARGAAAAAESTAEADRESSQGRHVVETAGTVVAELALEIREAHATVDTVAKAVEQIDTVLVVINGVAEQTNLLALNAAIEAARAGEQGRGFAVVADEVRTLAQRTQHSTQEIQQIIEALQEGVRAAVTRMNESAERAMQAQEQSARADQALTTIARAVSAIHSMATSIADAGESQRATADEVARRIKTIREVTEHALGGVHENQAVSDQLSELSERLRALVGRFSIGHASGEAPLLTRSGST